MLSDAFNIRYRHPDKTPIQLLISGDRLLIDCRFNYNQKALLPDPATGQIPANVIEEGIIRKWSGTYRVEWPGLAGPIEVLVRISRGRDRRSAPIRIRNLLLMPAHVISPIYRRIWGLLITGHLESLGINWSPTQPGCMVLPAGLDRNELASTAAHEAGHLFGLGDAYAAIYRFYDAVPGAEPYMMFSNQSVNPAEIRMLLQAHAEGRMQFFPLFWKSSRFFRGLRRDLIDWAKYVARQWAKYHPARKEK
jgi:hypothetical protein